MNTSNFSKALCMAGIGLCFAPLAKADDPSLSLIEIGPGSNWTITMNKNWVSNKEGKGKCKIFTTKPYLGYNYTPDMELKEHDSAFVLVAPKSGYNKYWLSIYPSYTKVDLRLDFKAVGDATDKKTFLALSHPMVGDTIGSADITFSDTSQNATCEKTGYRASTNSNKGDKDYKFIVLNSK